MKYVQLYTSSCLVIMAGYFLFAIMFGNVTPEEIDTLHKLIDHSLLGAIALFTGSIACHFLEAK